MSLDGAGGVRLPVTPPSQQPLPTDKADDDFKTGEMRGRSKLLSGGRPVRPAKRARSDAMGKSESSTLDRKAPRSENKIENLKPSKSEAASYTTELAPPTTTAGLAKMSTSAHLATFPYNHDIGGINEKAGAWVPQDPSLKGLDQWGIDADLATDLSATQTKSGKYERDSATGIITNKKTGLTAAVLKNDQTKEIRLVFGGTTSGGSSGGLNSRMVKNPLQTITQWSGNIKNAAGGVPASFEQAKEMTDGLVKKTSEPGSPYQGYKVVLSGHSKGSAEATYAALNREEPLPAECFSSAQLGSGAQKNIPKSSLEKATQFVTHYNVDGDLVPKAGNMMNGLGHLGNVVTIPASDTFSSPVDRHDQFHEHIEKYSIKQHVSGGQKA